MATIVQSTDELNKGKLPLKIADATNDDEAVSKKQLLNAMGEVISSFSFVNVSANADYTAKKYDRVLADTTNGSFTVTLPPSPSANDVVAIMDIASSFSTNPLSVAQNGNTIMGLDEDMEIDTDNISLELIFINNDWRIK